MIRTRRNRKIKIDHVAIAYHRNGVGGAGFHQVGFSWKDQEGIELWMVGLVFEAERHVVVMNLDDADQQWRGDTFEAVLRAAIAEWDTDASVAQFIGAPDRSTP